jgi:hypothetical protein
MPMPDGSFRPEAYEHDKTGWFWFGEPLPTYAEARRAANVACAERV